MMFKLLYSRLSDMFILLKYNRICLRILSLLFIFDLYGSKALCLIFSFRHFHPTESRVLIIESRLSISTQMLAEHLTSTQHYLTIL